MKENSADRCVSCGMLVVVSTSVIYQAINNDIHNHTPENHYLYLSPGTSTIIGSATIPR